MWGWLLLALAIVFEICGTTCMKFSEGFSKLVPSILIFIFYGLSFTAFTFALKQINLSIAYAIWAGLGTAMITIVGVSWFKEPMNALKIICLGLVIIGVTGLFLGKT